MKNAAQITKTTSRDPAARTSPTPQTAAEAEVYRLTARIAELEEFLRFVDRVNGSTGGPQAVVDEFKFRARALLSKGQQP